MSDISRMPTNWRVGPTENRWLKPDSATVVGMFSITKPHRRHFRRFWLSQPACAISNLSTDYGSFTPPVFRFCVFRCVTQLQLWTTAVTSTREIPTPLTPDSPNSHTYPVTSATAASVPTTLTLVMANWPVPFHPVQPALLATAHTATVALAAATILIPSATLVISPAILSRRHVATDPQIPYRHCSTQVSIVVPT